MTSGLLLQFLANAIINGGMFGLLGLSFGLIYSTSKILHFAHGAVYVCCAYLFFTLYGLWDLPLWLSVAGTIAGAGVLGFAVMRLFYQPLLHRRTSGVVTMIASLGLFIVVENLIVLVFGNDSRVVSKAAVQQGIEFGPVFLTPLQLITLATTFAAFVLLYALITWSRLGRALRGLADDAEMADIIGLNVRFLRYAVFALGSMTLALPVVLNSLDVGVAPGMGLSIVLIATISAIIGGVSNIFAGMAGGFVVGLLQSFGILWLDPRWQNLIIFSALILVLILRPAGLLAGKR